MKQITDKQKQFCYEYLKDFNAVQAAVRIGTNRKEASHHAFRMLKDPETRKFLKSLKEKHVEKAQLNIDSVLNEIRIIAFAIADGDLIKTSDKLRALGLLGRNLGMFGENDIDPKDKMITVRVNIVDKVGQEPVN